AGEDRARQTVREFMDRIERELRAEIADLEKELDKLESKIAGRLHESLQEEFREAPPSVRRKFVKENGDDDEIERWEELTSQIYAIRTQADIWLNLLSESKIGNVTKLCRRIEGILT